MCRLDQENHIHQKFMQERNSEILATTRDAESF